MNLFSIYWEFHHPNWLIFFRGDETTNHPVGFNLQQAWHECHTKSNKILQSSSPGNVQLWSGNPFLRRPGGGLTVLSESGDQCDLAKDPMEMVDPGTHMSGVRWITGVRCKTNGGPRDLQVEGEHIWPFNCHQRSEAVTLPMFFPEKSMSFGNINAVISDMPAILQCLLFHRYSLTNDTGWWFGTKSYFSHILGLVIPIDFHIFQRGRYTTNQDKWSMPRKNWAAQKKKRFPHFPRWMWRVSVRRWGVWVVSVLSDNLWHMN